MLICLWHLKNRGKYLLLRVWNAVKETDLLSPWVHDFTLRKAVKIRDYLPPHPKTLAFATLADTQLEKVGSFSASLPSNIGTRIIGSLFIVICWNQIRVLEAVWVILGENLKLYFRQNEESMTSLTSLVRGGSPKLDRP